MTAAVFDNGGSRQLGTLCQQSHGSSLHRWRQRAIKGVFVDSNRGRWRQSLLRAAVVEASNDVKGRENDRPKICFVLWASLSKPN